MASVVIAPVEDERARAAAYALRVEVFVHEQAVPPDLELDERDAEADHVLALVDGQAVATGRLVLSIIQIRRSRRIIRSRSRRSP